MQMMMFFLLTGIQTYLRCSDTRGDGPAILNNSGEIHMSSNNNSATPNRDHIILLGQELHGNELHFGASGLRALAAEKIMRESGISDADALFAACEELIGTENLFESYVDPLNTRPDELIFGELVLGEGCPLPSLKAYIALHKVFGDDWVLQAFESYFDIGDVGCADWYPAEVVESARQNLEAFIARDSEAVSRWTTQQLRTSGASRAASVAA